MKKSWRILLGIGVAAMTLASCSDDDSGMDLDLGQEAEIYVEDVNSAATVDAIFEDIDEALELEVGAIGARERKDDAEKFGSCATVTVDGDTKTIDFGSEGCEGRDGRLRKGIIRITKTGERGVEGSSKVVEFDGFEIDTMAIAGTRTLLLSTVTETSRVFNITLVGGSVSFPDGTTVTRESDRTRTITLGDDGAKIQATVFGTTNGTNKDELDYTHTIAEATPLLFTKECKDIGRLVPVSGILVIQIEGESDKTIDYGDGTCDNIAVVEQDGVSEEIEVKSRQTRRKHLRNKR